MRLRPVDRPGPPSVSVVIVADDRANHLGDAVASALSQSVAPAEVVVVDAGTSGGPASRLRGLAIEGLRYVRSGRTGTDADAWGEGIAATDGDVIVTLDPDDLLAHDALEHHLGSLAHPGTVSVGAVAEVDAGLGLIGVLGWEPGEPPARLAGRLASGETPPRGSLAMRRDALDALAGPAPGTGEGWHLEWLTRALVADRVVVTAAPVVLHRRGQSSGGGAIHVAPEVMAAVVRQVLEQFPLARLVDGGEAEAAARFGTILLRLGDLEAALACFEVLAEVEPGATTDRLIAAVQQGLDDPTITPVAPVELGGEPPTPSAPSAGAAPQGRADPPSSLALTGPADLPGPVTPVCPAGAAADGARPAAGAAPPPVTARPVAGSISIGVVTAGRAHLLDDALRSALAQTSPAEEVLVVDDASIATGATVVGAARVIRLADGGISAARNRCVAEATSERLLWLDADDVLEPWTVEAHRAAVVADPSLDVTYGDLVVTDERLVPAGLARFEDWRGHEGGNRLVAALIAGNQVPNPGTLLRRSTVLGAGGYDTAFERAEDHELWTRLAPAASFAHIGVVTARRRSGAEEWGSLGPAIARHPAEELTIVHRLLNRHPMVELMGTAQLADGLQSTGADPAEREAAAVLQIAVRLLDLGDLDGARRAVRSSPEVCSTPQGAEIVRLLDLAGAEDLGGVRTLSRPAPGGAGVAVL